jgi:hypothetical protein
MEAVVTNVHTKSDFSFFMDIPKRISAIINNFKNRDAYFVSLIDEGLKTPKVSMDEVMEALRT